MLKGDLVTTPLPAVLRQLADGVASGCLHVDDGVGSAAKVFIRGGQVYAVQVPGRRPQLGARLVSSGALGPEALAEALEAQRTELQGWRLGELLVHLGYVDQPVVEAFVDEQVREQATDLMRWPTGLWKFRVNERTREDVAPPTPVEDLLAEVEHRMAQWEVITQVLHGPDAVPMLSSAGQTDAEMAIDPDAWSLLCKVDGQRSVTELARECGFTLFEAGQVVYSLVRSGLLEVEEVVVGAELVTSPPMFDEAITSKLSAAFAPSQEEEEVEVHIPAQAEEPSPAEVANLVANALREDRSLEAPPPVPADSIDASVDRVSAALSEMLGDTSPQDDLFAAPKPRRGRPKPEKPKTASEIERDKKAAARVEREAKRRARDAEELAKAQAELMADRAAEAEAAAAKLSADHQAEIVNLEEVRKENARAAAEAERVEAERVEAERVEAERAEAERLEAERVAAEHEAARQAAEAQARAQAEAELRAAAEAEQAAAAAAEADRIAAAEAEQLAAAEAAEAQRVEAERLAAEEAARHAAAVEERAAAEAELRAAADADAAAAEAETERLAALEAERVAAEQAAADELAAEEAARHAAAVEERAAAEAELRAAEAEQAAEAVRLEAAADAQRIVDEQAAADAEHDEALRVQAQRSDNAGAFAELSAAAASSGDTLVVEPEAVAADLDDEDLDDDVDEGPLPVYASHDTDMASLFRELSSLGLEDQPSADAPTAPRPAPKPATPAAGGAKDKQKKKGLFGR